LAPVQENIYIEEDRLRIIADHEHQVGNNSVVAIKGLHPLESTVKLINGVYTTIRPLLLSMPAQGTTTGKLFIQVERQLDNDWLLCCLHTVDAVKVTQRLSTLEDSLRKVIHPDSFYNLFLTEAGLTFNGKVAPLAKGKSRLPHLDVPTKMANYVSQSMQRLHTPTAKRQAVELQVTEDDQMDTQPTSLTVTRQAPATPYATGVTPHALQTVLIAASPTSANNHQHSHSNPTIRELQLTADSHSNTLSELKDCCATLMQTQHKLAAQMIDMNNSINRKFDQMASSIDNLHLSPTRHSNKIHKDFHRSLPDQHMHS